MNELFLKRMENILKDDYPLLLKSYEQLPRKSLQLNTFKISEQVWEDKKLFKIKKIDTIKDAYYFAEESLGNHPYHQAGLFYIQEPSAMLPPLSIPIQDDFKILDLCAAPGGKTHILAKQVPNGYVLANEFNYKRAKKLLSNIERLGLNNVMVSSMSVLKLQEQYQHYFDVVLVDAPCSGEGMFRKDKEAIKNWSLDKVKQMSNLQKDLLKKASTLVKTDGYLIYSTCTFSKEENEEVVESLLKDNNFVLVEVNKNIQNLSRDGLNNLTKTRRCYPFIFGEGQFIAVFKKVQKCEPFINSNELQNLDKLEENNLKKILDDNMKKQPFILKKYKGNIVALPHDWEVPNLALLSCGVKLGDYNYKHFVFHHQLAKAYGNLFYNTYNLSLNDDNLVKYLKGEEIKDKVPDGYGVVMVDNYPLGFYKASQGRLKNYYPKGLRK